MIPRYTRERMAGIWEDRYKFEIWLKIEMLVCEAWHRRGVIPLEDLENIREKAGFDIQRIDELERTVRHDVISFLTAVAENVGDSSRFIHLGLTSSDLLDTSLAVMMKEAGELILEEVDRLLEVLEEKARAHARTLTIGRTHGVHAEPTTFGLKLTGFYDEIGRGRKRFREALKEASTGKISGAVGNYLHLDPLIEEEVCQSLGLRPAAISSQIIQRDAHASYLNTLALLASSLERLSLEIRHLCRTEVAEVQEAFTPGQKGSSAMPHKKNPVTAEQICGLARVVRANASAAMENMPLWHERDISHSSVERIIMPDSTILMDYMLAKTADMVRNLVVFPKKMEANLQLTGGGIFSESVLLGLIKSGLSREEAYTIVQSVSHKAMESGVDFREALQSDARVTERLSRGEIDACFSPERVLDRVDDIFRRVYEDGRQD